MKTTISKALRVKKRLVEQIRQHTALIRSNNSVLAGNEPDCNVVHEIAERRRTSQRLVGVKIAIETASAPIRHLILTLSEKKDEIAMLRALDCTKGKKAKPYSGDAEEYSAVISDTDRRRYVTEIESEIDNLQEMIDEFNAAHKLEIPD